MTINLRSTHLITPQPSCHVTGYATVPPTRGDLMTFLTAWKIVVNPWEYEFNANAVSLAIGRKDRGWVTAAVNDSQGTGIHLKHTHPSRVPSSVHMSLR